MQALVWGWITWCVKRTVRNLRHRQANEGHGAIQRHSGLLRDLRPPRRLIWQDLPTFCRSCFSEGHRVAPHGIGEGSTIKASSQVQAYCLGLGIIPNVYTVWNIHRFHGILEKLTQSRDITHRHLLARSSSKSSSACSTVSLMSPIRLVTLSSPLVIRSLTRSY